MFIYCLSLILLLFIGVLFSKANLKSKKLICICSSMIIFVLIGFRSPYVGNDTVQYFNHYMKFSVLSLPDCLTRIKGIEYGYAIFVKTLTYVSPNPITLLVVTSLIISTCLGLFIYKNSENPILSYYLYITLGFLMFALTAVRQTLAISIVLLSIETVKKKKLIWFLLIVILAATFHTSALFFLPVYFLAYKKLDWKSYFLYGFLMLLSLPILQFVNSAYMNSFGTSYRIEGSNGGYVVLIFLIIVFISTILYNKLILIRDEANIIFINILLMTIFLWIVRNHSQIAERVANYYYIFIIVLIPKILHSLNDKNLIQLVYFLAYTLTFLLMFYRLLTSDGTYYYHFIWE